jgi:predicted amidohydrolase YtcJ
MANVLTEEKKQQVLALGRLGWSLRQIQKATHIEDGRWAEGRIGHDRASRTYAFRTFLNHGVRLALGTDWDVAPLDPNSRLLVFGCHQPPDAASQFTQTYQKHTF